MSNRNSQENRSGFVANTRFDLGFATVSYLLSWPWGTKLPASDGGIFLVRRFGRKKFKKLSRMDDLNIWPINL